MSRSHLLRPLPLEQFTGRLWNGMRHDGGLRSKAMLGGGLRQTITFITSEYNSPLTLERNDLKACSLATLSSVCG